MKDVRDSELERLKWLSETLKRQLLHRFTTDPDFLKRSTVNTVNWDSSKGGCLHTRGSATIPKTLARMKRANDLLTEFSANFEQATQQAQKEGDESIGTVDSNIVQR
ncbi:hypothetical protein PIB30_040531 [Stylosanthes scabra]|uniref:Uncharacterized protein n=1 Tax=Stylosanthes scabra TaxID=79078 RepID=A0ABU6SFP6_9FABA|nr:hypothetical protein [Stylosanthes scabra]